MFLGGEVYLVRRREEMVFWSAGGDPKASLGSNLHHETRWPSNLELGEREGPVDIRFRATP